MVQDSDALVRVNTYECLDCGGRVRSAYKPATCENCGGDLRDLSRQNE